MTIWYIQKLNLLIQFHPKQINFTGNLMNKESTNWEIDAYVYDSQSERYIIKMHRLPQNALASMVIPFTCFNVLVGLVYILPANSGERVGYSITLVLTFSVLLMSINTLVPTSSKTMIHVG